MGTLKFTRQLAADTSLSQKDTSEIHRESPSRSINELILQCLRKTANGLKSDRMP
jgi:hypothetical protein